MFEEIFGVTAVLVCDNNDHATTEYYLVNRCVNSDGVFIHTENIQEEITIQKSC